MPEKGLEPTSLRPLEPDLARPTNSATSGAEKNLNSAAEKSNFCARISADFKKTVRERTYGLVVEIMKMVRTLLF